MQKNTEHHHPGRHISKSGSFQQIKKSNPQYTDVKSGNRQYMNDSRHLVTNLNFIFQVIFLTKQHCFKNTGIILCRNIQRLHYLTFQILHKLTISGIFAAPCQNHTVFHKIVDFLTGVKLPGIKFSRISWLRNFFQFSRNLNSGSDRELFIRF